MISDRTLPGSQLAARVLETMLLCALMGSAAAQTNTGEMPFTRGLMIRSAPGFPDNIAGKDPIEAALVSGTWRAPEPGDTLRYNDTLKGVWEEIRADSSGWYDNPRLEGAYLYFELNLAEKSIAILRPMGNSLSYVNGIPRAGNPYGTKDSWEPWEPRFDYTLLPLELHAGKNWFLFYCTRGRFKAGLRISGPAIFFNMRDCTLPDLIEGRAYEGFGAVVVVNATRKVLKNLRIESALEGGPGAGDLVPVIQPLSVRKVRVSIHCRSPLPAGSRPLTLRLV